ncbi:MAG: HlyD family efflux transporter periplasmic adaptor subunit [Bacillota bacterium]
MKIRISKKTRRILLLYLAVLVALYIVVFQMPKMSDKFETTQVLQNGTLEVSCGAEGYIIKDEAICTAESAGTIEYKIDDGTVVKKGTTIVGIESEKTEKESEIRGKYQKCLDKLKGYDLLKETSKAPISGVFSMSMDGNEKYLSIGNMDKIKREEVESLDFGQVKLEREKARKGEPVFKISSDDAWYIICWVEKADARKYEEGEKVRITIDDSTLDARVQTIKRDGDSYRMVFYLNVYYEDFCSARKVTMTVVQSNTMGLIVDNECIIEKDGQQGVYVKTKDGDTYFRPIKVKITDGKQSVIYESIYVNDKYEQVETVRVYQEVLRHPQEALEQDLADD